MSAWTCRQLSERSPKRSFHLVFESHDGTAYVPIPERSTSLRVTSTPPVVDSQKPKALDPKRPIREADIGTHSRNVRFVPKTDICNAAKNVAIRSPCRRVAGLRSAVRY